MLRLVPPNSARLSFREMSHDDFDFMSELLGDPRVMRYYPKPLVGDEVTAWIDRQLARYIKDGHGPFIVTNRATSEPLGQVGLMMQEVDGEWRPEVGYILHHKHWRQGFATEAATTVRDYAFYIQNYRRVFSLVRPENAPSRGVAEKIGMTLEKETLFKGLLHQVFSVTAK